MISRKEILMGRDKDHPLTKELEDNLTKLLEAVNKLRKAYGKPMFVSSGYRPAAFNKAAGGAKRSSHMSCQAVDFKDADREISKWCLANMDKLKEWRLYLEDPAYTPTWCHLQIRPTRNNPFKP